jgi:predicted nucleotidyltransferase
VAERPTPQLNPILDQLRKINPYLKQRWGVKIVAVFGSVVLGEATESSDVDVMFDYDKPLGWDLSQVGDYLEEQLDYKVDMLSKNAIRPQVWSFIQEDMRYV